MGRKRPISKRQTALLSEIQRDRREGVYDIILADPPWHFKTRSEKGQGRSPSKHYPTMSPEEIKSLPVSNIAAKNAILLLWGVWRSLPLALDVMSAWGFDYRTEFLVWCKTINDGSRLAMGTGYYTRANSEFCLLGVKGKVIPVQDHSQIGAFVEGVAEGDEELVASLPSRAIISPRRKHSQKPLLQYEMIDKLWPGMRKVELFARNERPGWSAIGNEIDGKDIREVLNGSM